MSIDKMILVYQQISIYPSRADIVQHMERQEGFELEDKYGVKNDNIKDTKQFWKGSKKQNLIYETIKESYSPISTRPTLVSETSTRSYAVMHKPDILWNWILWPIKWKFTDYVFGAMLLFVSDTHGCRALEQSSILFTEHDLIIMLAKWLLVKY